MQGSHVPVLTYLSLTAYAAACALCLLAAGRTVRRGLPRLHAVHWLAGAALMAGLSLMRMFNLEETIKQALRNRLLASGEYEVRWELQGPAAALALVLAAGLLAYLLRAARRDWAHSWLAALRLADLAMAGFAALIAFRFISYHPVDLVLYFGPVRPNWVLDGLFTVTLAACAAHFSFGRPIVRDRLPGTAQ